MVRPAEMIADAIPKVSSFDFSRFATCHTFPCWPDGVDFSFPIGAKVTEMRAATQSAEATR